MFLEWKTNYFKNLNLFVPLLTLMIIIIGFIVLSSAVEINNPEQGGMNLIYRQLTAAVLGLGFIFLMQFIDYRKLKYFHITFYVLTIGLLVYILFSAEQIGGARRWLSWGWFRFQPSEFAKIFVVLFLASYLEKKEDELQTLKGFLKPFILISVPFVLILLQNDLGTALILLFIFLAMLFVAGANRKMLLVFIGALLLITVLIIVSQLFLEVQVPFLQEYQINRLLIFINPGIDPQGSGYNVIQSLIAVGSGGFSGKGWFAGTQNQLNFLPEKHTDFIFAVFGEEFGFIGVSVLLILYFFLLSQFINIALEIKDKYGKLIITGIASMFFFHIFENIGMSMGLMPITGIPLPFLSYGGSSMVAFLIGIGLIINVNIHRKKLGF